MREAQKFLVKIGGVLGIRLAYSLAAVIILCVFSLSSAIVHGWSGKVVAVKDGDTIVALHDGRGETIRLRSPEKRQDFGNQAKQTLSDLVLGRWLKSNRMDTDRYNRTVALVTIGMRTANEAMVEAGMAWVFEKYCRKAFCEGWRGLQERAKSKKIGLWSHPKQIPPWEWRHKNKGSQEALTRG